MDSLCLKKIVWKKVKLREIWEKLKKFVVLEMLQSIFGVFLSSKWKNTLKCDIKLNGQFYFINTKTSMGHQYNLTVNYEAKICKSYVPQTMCAWSVQEHLMCI